MSGIDIDLLRREECQPLTMAQMNMIKSQFHPANTANVNMVNYKYSTDEHIVGEWIDGRPIYEKTCVGNCADMEPGGHVAINLGPFDGKIPIEVSGYMNVRNQATPPLKTYNLVNHTAYNHDGGFAFMESYVFVNPNADLIFRYAAGAKGWITTIDDKYYISIKYIKTTD